MSDSLWGDFARAVVRVGLDDGAQILSPAMPGEVGLFPFDRPVHIITAYNQRGHESTEATNLAQHTLLEQELQEFHTIPTVGSGPDGTFPEPGFAILEISTGEALRVGKHFHQEAIYRWTASALYVLGVFNPVEISLGWRLDTEDGSSSDA